MWNASVVGGLFPSSARRLSILHSHLCTESKTHINSCNLFLTRTSSNKSSQSQLKKKDTRNSYKHLLTIQSRWKDNDIYGHVNNVEYYSYFDTLVNDYLIKKGGLNIHKSNVIGIVVETFCQFHKSVSFPDVIEGALRVSKIGNSSVKYEIGIFKKEEQEPCANGHFVHVFVDRNSNKPVQIPLDIKNSLQQLMIEEQ